MNVKQSVASLLRGRSPQVSAGLEGGSDQRGISSKSNLYCRGLAFSLRMLNSAVPFRFQHRCSKLLS